jgi:probable phosphoglycerate mutase
MSHPTKKDSPPQYSIFLLRHGAIQTVKDGKRYIGWQDIALSDEGVLQARKWADYFVGIALKEIYCSDLVRCLETARMIGDRCSLEPKVLSELREINLGDWDGERFDTVRVLYPQSFLERGKHIADHRPPKGESFGDLQERVWPVFESIAQRLSGHTLIITHAGVIRVLICRILGMPLANLFCIGQVYGALNIIEVRKKKRRLSALNLHFGK